MQRAFARSKMVGKSRRFGRSWGAPRPIQGLEQRLDEPSFCDEASFCEAGRLRPGPAMSRIWLLQQTSQSMISWANIRFSHQGGVYGHWIDPVVRGRAWG